MLRIKILGIGCKKSRALRANLMSALHALPIDASVEEVDRVEDIMQYQILATPALLIDQRIVTEGIVPDVRALQILIKSYHQTRFAMKKILVPTDFSHTASNAFQFAASLARQFDSEVTLLHVYHPHFDPNNPLAGKDKHEIADDLTRRMDAFVGENTSPANRKDKNIAYQRLVKEVQFGFAAEEISQISKDYDFIVMGTTGDGDWLEKLFGSVSSHVAQHAHCPVLLVPEKARFKGFRTVVYASNHASSDKLLIEKIVDAMQIPTDAIHLVHVEENPDEEYVLRNGRHELISRDEKKDINLTLADIKANSILKALNEYAVSHRADLIMMRTTERSFLQNVFHRSLTKQMVLTADQIPLLVLHVA